MVPLFDSMLTILAYHSLPIQNSRSKKVKCVLKPDEPFCENCSSAGKECLFRIDDLSPALRLERFAEYGPPSENARQIASTNKKSKSSSSNLSRARTSSSNAEGTPSEGNDAEESDQKGRRLSNENKANGKSKAVFRSFANPTKLGAPSRSGAPNNATISLEATYSTQAASSPRSQEFLHSQRYATTLPVGQQQISPYSATGTGTASTARSYGPTTVTPHAQQYNYPYQSTSYYEQAPDQMPHQAHMQASGPISAFQDHEAAASWQYPQPQPLYSPAGHDNGHYRPPIAQSHDRDQRRLSATSSNSQTALPSFRSAFSAVDSRLNDKTGDKSRQQQDGSALVSRSPSSGSRYRAMMSPKRTGESVEFASIDSNSRSGTALTPSVSWTDGYGPATDFRHSSSSYVRQSPIAQHNRSGRTNVSSNSIVLPPVLTPRSGLTTLTEMDTSLPSSKQQINAASPAIAPSRNDLAASNEDLATETEGESRLNGGGGARRKSNGADVSQDQESVAETSSTSSRPPPTFKKIALPFFRWFGATANTPGIRRIKVGVYHETDMEEEHGGELHDEESSAMPAESREDAADLKSPVIGSDVAAAGGVEGPATTPREAVAKSTPRVNQQGGESALSTSSRDLFESERPRYPRRDILTHLVNLFIKYFKASCFPWLDEAELVAGAQSGELPAILANSICAVTARFSNHVDLRRGPVKSAGEPFADMSKVLIVPMLSWPSVDVIEALVIISYSEFAAGADAGLWMYIGMALRMATDLGLQHEVTVKSMANKKQQDRARLLFWAIVCLDRITCFGTGRPVTVREDSFDCELPPLGDEPSSDGFVFGHIVRTLLKRGRIGELLNRRTDDLSLEERGRKLRTMWLDLAEYYDSLPPTLHFGVNTFRKLAAANQGAAFVYLHVLLQSTMSLLNRPSLLRRFDKDFSISAPTKLASIANHASGTIVSILRFAEDARQERNNSQDSKDENPMVNPYIDCNPYLDQLILPAGRAFLTEREAVRDALRRLGYAAQSRPVSRGGLGTGNEAIPASTLTGSAATDGPFNGLISSRQYAQTNLATCQKMLDRLALWWSGASWPARALRQETAGASGNDVEPDGNDEDAQPAPIRDVEMVLKWAKARVKRIRAYQKTPAASRRASFDASSSGGLLDGQQNSNNLDVNTELRSLLGGQGYVAGDSTSSGDSPLGLGFSGSFGTTSDIDIQALINAWANEENFIDSTQQVQSDLTSRPQDWSTVSPGQFANIPTTSSSTSHQTPQQFIPSVLAKSHLQTPNMVGLDLNAMQLEEFFFKSEFEGNQVSQMQDHQSASSMALNPSSSNNTLDVPIDDFGGVNGLDDLPSALFNAFTYHAGATTRDHNGHLLSQPGKRTIP